MFVQVLGSMLDDPAAVPGSSKDAEEEGDSYEELVMKRVAAYVQQSQVRGTNTQFYHFKSNLCKNGCTKISTKGKSALKILKW